MASFYLRRGSKVMGPVTVAKLKEAAASGKLKPEDEIRKGADGRWQLASSVKGLFVAPEPVDEWDSLASMEAEGTEFDDYVSGDESVCEDTGGEYRPSSQEKKGRRKEQAASSGWDSNKLFWIFSIVVGGLILIAVGVGLAIPRFGAHVAFGIYCVGGVLGFMGTIWLMLMAFEEGAMTGLLFLFCSPFSLYFFITRFDGSMPFRLTIASWIVSLVGVLYGFMVVPQTVL